MALHLHTCHTVHNSMSTTVVLLETDLSHGSAVMTSSYPDPDCKCTSKRTCSKHVALPSHYSQQHSPELDSPEHAPSRPFAQITQTPAPPALSQTAGLDPGHSPWSVNYSGSQSRADFMSNPYIQDSTGWDTQLHPTALSYPPPVQNSLPTTPRNPMLEESSSDATAHQLVQPTNYLDMFDASNTGAYAWLPHQSWMTNSEMSPAQLWPNNNIIPTQSIRDYGIDHVPSSIPGHEASVRPNPVDAVPEHMNWPQTRLPPTATAYAPHLPAANAAFPLMPPAGTPPRYWMVRTDSIVIEMNGALFIELDGTAGARERVPAARFEHVFQDALQDNRTSPISMRNAWQIRKDGGKATITYVGPCSAGVIKTRKSSIFAPFIGLHNGQHCVMLVDDTNGSGAPRLRALRSSPYLPNTISTRETGWLMEAVLRRDWTITIEDVMDRMLSRIRLDISTYNRWRRHDKAVYEFEDDPRSRY